MDLNSLPAIPSTLDSSLDLGLHDIIPIKNNKTTDMHNYDSSRGEYTISNYKATKATDADFIFDAASHKDVEVIDMR